MNTEKLLLLAGKIMHASATKNSEALKDFATELAEALNAPSANKHLKKEKEICVFLKFTDKEISKMPKKFRILLRVEGYSVHVRRRKRSANVYHYEARLRKDNLNISVSSTNPNNLKSKFILALKKYELEEEGFRVPRNFDDFATYYFETFRKRKVATKTLAEDIRRYNRWIKPTFGKMQLRDITPGICQRLIDKLTEDGKCKTAIEIHSLLNIIFKSAMAHNIITHNPLSIVITERHEKKHGKALTRAEERLLLESTAGTPFQTMFAVAVYTGLRPNEYKTARIEGQFIVAVNSKRKHKRIEYKKIPISPMLAPYLKDIEKLWFYIPETLRDKIRSILPNHKLYDLRTTFYTRCQECNVAPAARDEFVGHSAGVLVETYTDLSDEFLLKEGQKLNY